VIQTISNCAPGYADPWQDDAMGWSLANDLLGVASVESVQNLGVLGSAWSECRGAG
jgi:hypothetical protein